jgi:hypothetical protein
MKQTFFKIVKCLTVLVLLNSCSNGQFVKFRPEYPGVDPKVQNIVDEYMYLSKQDHLEFYNTVTIGFKKLNSNDVIGVCTYGLGFREIDLDTTYWNESTNTSHMALLFHELTHCYCGRDHDYSDGIKYPKTEAARLVQALQWKIRGGERPGYWDDGCPISVMHPVILDDICMLSHYSEYTKEMFNRCQPW